MRETSTDTFASFLSTAGLKTLSVMIVSPGHLCVTQLQPHILVQQQPHMLLQQQPHILVHQQPHILVQQQPRILVQQQPRILLHQQPHILVQPHGCEQAYPNKWNALVNV